jgi:PAS domain S-box-containing protein
MIPILGLFTIALIEIGLAGAVLARNPTRPVNRWFAAYTAVLAAWAVVNGTFRVIVDPPLTLIAARTAFAAAALIAVTVLRFADVFPQPGPPPHRLMQLATLAGLFMCGLAYSPWIVASVRLDATGSQPVYGPLHGVFALYFVTCYTWALIHLARKLRRAKGFARAQLQYLFLGTGLACLGGVTTNLLVPLVFGTSRFSVYGPYFTLLVVAFAAHSIVRHRLMDIRVVISRWTAYAVGWVLTAGVLVTAAVLLSEVMLGYNMAPAVDVLLGLAASVAFLFVAPVTRRLADRYLHRPAYDAAQLVREGSRLMGTLADPERVTAAMAELVGTALRPESLVIVVRERERDTFRPGFVRLIDPATAWSVTPLTIASPLVRELRENPGGLLIDELSHRAPSRQVASIAAELRDWRAEVAVPVRRDGELIAIILLGAKLSGDPYFGDDLDLLETMAGQLAIGLENGQLYQEIVSIKEYNERILARMDSGVVAVRDDGVVTTFNPAAERITGLGGGSVLGGSLQGLDPALQGILQACLAGQPDAETEVGIAHPDGRSLPLLTHTSALHDASGHVRGAIAVFNDHSRLKALEEDKRRVDRLAAMGALATGIAHEIRNPLVAIKTFAELLPERADDQEFRSTFAKVAAREVNRIEELLGRLRALAVPAVTTLHPLDLAGPIAETLDLLRGEADRRHIRVVTELEPDLPPVLGEADQLKQLFLNLFLNALEAMATGGTLSVTVRVDRPRRAASRSKLPFESMGFVTVRVTDTGPGIPREDLHRVFEPFFTTKSQGTGLGLAICRGIADAHRARLWAEAGPAGAGTAFVAQFPALAGVPAAEVFR